MKRTKISYFHPHKFSSLLWIYLAVYIFPFVNCFSSLELRHIFNHCESSAANQVIAWETISSIFGTLEAPSFTANTGLVNISRPLEKIAKIPFTFRPIPQRSKVHKTLNIFYLATCPSSEVSGQLIQIKNERFFHKGNDYTAIILDIELSSQFARNIYLRQIRHAVILSFPKTEANPSSHETFHVLKLCYFCHETFIPTPQLFQISRRPSQNHLQDIFSENQIPNYQRKTIEVSCSNNTKVRLFLLPKSDGTVQPQIPGVFASYLSHFVQKLNYSAVYRTATHGGGTGVLLNGYWNGVTGDVHRETAQIGVVVGLNVNRFEVVAFTNPGEYQALIMITRQHYQIFSWTLVSIPLHNQVWILMGCTLVISTLTIYGIQLFYRVYIIPRQNATKKIRLWDNNRIMEYLFSSFFEEHAPSPTIPSLQLFLSLWLFCSVTLGTAYNSKLFSVLAFPPLDFQPKNFDELVTSQYKWGLNTLGDAALLYLKASTDPVGKQLYKGMDAHADSIKCIAIAMNQKYACITYGTVLDFAIARNFTRSMRRSLTESTSSIYTLAAAFITQKDSPLEEELNRIIGQSFAQDLQRKWLDLYHGMVKKGGDVWRARLKRERAAQVQEDQTGPGSERKFVKFSIKKLQGAFFALFIGLGISMGVVLSEVRNKLFCKVGRQLIEEP